MHVSNAIPDGGFREESGGGGGGCSRSVVVHLSPGADEVLTLSETELLSYSPEITVPHPYLSDNKFEAQPEPIAAFHSAGGGEGRPGKGKAKAKARADERRGGNSRRATEKLEDAVGAALPSSEGENDGPGGGGEGGSVDDYASRVSVLLREFTAKSDSGGWPSCTSVACFWCCEQFPGPPVGLPVGYADGGASFMVTGCFCSLPCAAAFNQDSDESNSVKCSRHSMMCAMSMRAGVGDDVPLAPPRQMLERFGGRMSVDEFRAASGAKVFLCSLPPLRCLPAQVEEVSEASISCGFRDLPQASGEQTDCGVSDASSSETSSVSRSGGGLLTLRRTKPLYEYRNTLDHTMGLRIGSGGK